MTKRLNSEGLFVQKEISDLLFLTGKFMSVPGPQYFKAARSYALAAASSSSYAPTGIMRKHVTKTSFKL